MIPTRWFDKPAYHDPVYEPVWSACAETGLVVHTHSGAGPADYALGPGIVADLRHRGVVVGGAAVLGAAPVRRVRPPPDAASTRSPRTAPGGCPTSSSAWTRSGSAATTPASSATCSERPVDASRASTSTELLPRRLDAGRRRDRAPSRDRRRQPAVGQRPPAPRGHLAPHPRRRSTSVSTTCPTTRPRRILGDTAAEALPLRPRRAGARSSSASARPPARSTVPHDHEDEILLRSRPMTD